jgi:transposase
MNDSNQECTKPWTSLTHFAGHDWAKDHHDLVVVDATGQIVLDLRIADTAEGWNELRTRLQAFGHLGVAIETRAGAAVERLLEAGLTVFPVCPKATRHYRERKAPSGTKTDRLEAWALADALRTDGRDWRPLRPEDPLIQELRLLCRDEMGLIEQRTALVNQLQQALYEYYPAALEAFDDWTQPFTWTFVERFPTPQGLVRAGKRAWEKFLHTHKLYRPETCAKRLDLFARAEAFCGSPAVTNAKSRLAVALARQLRVLQTQLDEYRRRIEELFNQHPDAGLFGSLPGLGEKLAPRLLSELGQDRQRFPDPQALQCYAGTAPVSFQSGQIRKALFRRACNKSLRATVHLWANLSRARCTWAEVYYRQKRAQGKSHACALRCLGQRWLKILWKMWQTRTGYDEQRHTQNQIQHGSWVLALNPTPASH